MTAFHSFRGAQLGSTDLVVSTEPACLAAAVETMLDGFIVLAALHDDRGEIVDFECTFANDAARRICGLSPDQTVGARVLALFPSLAQAVALSRGVVATGVPLITAISVQEPTLSGTFEVRAAKLDDGVTVSFREIGDRLCAEAQTRQRERQLAEAQRLAHLGSWEWDVERHSVAWSDELYQICGLDPADGPPRFRRLLDHIHPQDRDQVAENRKRAVAQGRSFSQQCRILRLDGQVRTVMARGEPVRDQTDHLVRLVGTVQDVTERKQAEEQLEKAKTELERRTAELVRSNADLEQFASVVSHDLQAPLRTVAGFVDLLMSGLGKQASPELTEYAGFITGGVERMRDLITDLLTYSRVGTRPGELAPTQMDEVLERVRVGLETTIRTTSAGISSGPLPTVLADTRRFEHLLQNLLDNALKFRHPERTPQISVSAARRADGWVFTVADNGIGLDPHHAERIFGVFQRLHSAEDYPGSGIGLAICKKVVERRGGSIWVRSSPGGGARFSFSVPDEPPRAAA